MKIEIETTVKTREGSPEWYGMPEQVRFGGGPVHVHRYFVRNGDERVLVYEKQTTDDCPPPAIPPAPPLDLDRIATNLEVVGIGNVLYSVLLPRLLAAISRGVRTDWLADIVGTIQHHCQRGGDVEQHIGEVKTHPIELLVIDYEETAERIADMCRRVDALTATASP